MIATAEKLCVFEPIVGVLCGLIGEYVADKIETGDSICGENST